jgi:hypothetical protein
MIKADDTERELGHKRDEMLDYVVNGNHIVAWPPRFGVSCCSMMAGYIWRFSSD